MFVWLTMAPFRPFKELELELENFKIFYKDCSLGSVKNLTASPC